MWHKRLRVTASGRTGLTAHGWAFSAGLVLLAATGIGANFLTSGATRGQGTMSNIKPTYLRCEYVLDPLGIDSRQPRLSWVLEHTRPEVRDEEQSAHQILVAGSTEALEDDRGDLWDTGKVDLDQSTQVVYSGKPLGSRMQAYWKVRVWDKGGNVSEWSKPARWTMGLLEPSDWQAKWISDSTPLPPLVSAHNGYHSAFARSADTPKWVAIDLGKRELFDTVQLFPARPYDYPDTPGFLFPVRFRVDVSDTAEFAAFRTVVDQTARDVPNPGTEPPVYSFAPSEGRYVRLMVTRLRLRDGDNYAFALAEMQVLSGETNLALGARVTALDSVETGSWSTRNLVDGDLISHPGTGPDEALPVQMLRNEFGLPANVRQAIVYVTALGVYELRINGQRVGDHILAPEWTDYHTRVQYQTYDVTALVREGKNAVGALLGDGWYAGRLGMSEGIVGKRRGIYGRKPWLLVQMEIEMSDDHRQTIVSDGSWRATRDGPILSSDILDGEVYDARREMLGWDAPGFEDEGWKPVEVQEDIDAALVAQPNEPIRVVKELRAVALTEPSPGVYIFDLGQNMVGWCRVTLSGDAGTTVTFRHAEALKEDGTLYTDNLRGAPQIDRYRLRGRAEETFEPHFTYHGFRYVELTGLPGKPELGDLVGCVFCSSSPEVGTFECSDPMLNRLWQNILWTQRANLESVPTDCPQRDERLGWMGDIQAFSQAAIFNMDLAAFFTKWVRDIRDAQADDGRYADFSPQPYGRNERFTGTPAWGDAGIVIPWQAYQNYGDVRILEEHLDSAKRWVDYVHSLNPDLIWRKGRGNDYNDWLNGDTLVQEGWPTQGGAVPNEVLATAFFAHSTEIVSKMATVLGRSEDAKRYAELLEGIKAAFNQAFVDAEGRVLGNTQAGYALAVDFNLLPESMRPAAARHMVEGIGAYNDHVSTGIQTTHRMMLELTRNGYNDVAYQLINNRTCPSWGYMVDNGATTIWERWDGYVKGRGFQNPGMNSFNHWAFGSVGEWMVRVILGIEPDESSPGYKHFIIRPRPGGGLTWAKGEYNSIRGRIATSWRIEAGAFALDVVIPANAAATVYIPAQDAEGVTEGGRPAIQAAGIKFIGIEEGSAVLLVGSGHYSFVSPWAG